MSKTDGGLQLQSLVLLYEKIKVSQASVILTSKDRVTAHVALMELKQEESQQRAAFKPMQLAKDEMVAGASGN